MSSATTNSAVVPSPPLDASTRSLPTLEQLYQMTAEPDERVVIRDVDWAFYEQLVDSIPEGANIHVDYGDFSTIAGDYRSLAWWSVFIVSAREVLWASRNMSSAIRPLMVG
jgi:hypothetical protein